MDCSTPVTAGPKRAPTTSVPTPTVHARSASATIPTTNCRTAFDVGVVQHSERRRDRERGADPDPRPHRGETIVRPWPAGTPFGRSRSSSPRWRSRPAGGWRTACAGKGFAWEARERDGGGLAVRVDREEKQLLLDANPEAYFTSPHYNGFPAIQIRVEQIERDELRERLEDAWLIQAPKRLAAAYMAAAD